MVSGMMYEPIIITLFVPINTLFNQRVEGFSSIRSLNHETNCVKKHPQLLLKTHMKTQNVHILSCFL